MASENLIKSWYSIDKSAFTPNSIIRNLAYTLLPLSAAIFLGELLYRLDNWPQSAIVWYVFAIFIIAALTDGFFYGILAACIGALIYDFLITPPRFTLQISVSIGLLLLSMLAVALTTSAVRTRIKRQGHIVHEKDRHAMLLYQVNDRLMSSRDVASIVTHAAGYLSENLKLPIAFFENPLRTGALFIKMTLMPGMPEDLFQTPQVFKDAARVFTTGMPFYGAIRYQPLIAHGDVLGVFCVACGQKGLTVFEEDFFSLITSQTAQALRVQALAAAEEEARIRIETEQARNRFLSAISHDLRTPLTSILGASAALLDGAPDIVIHDELVRDIHADSEWLLRMVENILSVTRLHGDMKVDKTLEAAEEVVAEAVASVRKRFPHADISVIAPGELLLVPMDGILISQVLVNLLENAIRHANAQPLRITVWVESKDSCAQFSVLDNGMGIAENILPYLFEMHPGGQQRQYDASRGLGMGLSICRTIITAHGGVITGHNRSGGGACFTFSLPLEQEVSIGE